VIACCVLVTGVSPVYAETGGGWEILGVRLQDTPAQVGEHHPELSFAQHVSRTGQLLGIKAFTQKGYRDGGFFQVLFAPEAMGEGAWSVTRNTRLHRAGQQPEPLLEKYVEQYGPYELLCREQFPSHAVFHVYWLSAPADCSNPGVRPETTYLYLNLVTGKWTEEFLVLVDPGMGRAIRQRAAPGNE